MKYTTLTLSLLLTACGGGVTTTSGTSTTTITNCDATVTQVLSTMASPSFNSLGVPDIITHYPNTVGESEVSYTWTGLKTTMIFQWNTATGMCLETKETF
jgi:hypothetical protein